MSKNNIKEYSKKMKGAKQRFGLRKLSVGVASVLLGTTVMLTTSANADSGTVQSLPVSTDTTDTNSRLSQGTVKLGQNSKYEAGNTLDIGSIVTQSSNSALAESKIGGETVENWNAAPSTSEVPARDGWFTVQVSSPALINVRQGDTYVIKVGNGLPLNPEMSI